MKQSKDAIRINIYKTTETIIAAGWRIEFDIQGMIFIDRKKRNIQKNIIKQLNRIGKEIEQQNRAVNQSSNSRSQPKRQP